MELMIGTIVSSEVTPSSLIFHTKIDSEDNTEEDEAIYILTENWGFKRPNYIANKKEKDEKSIMYSIDWPDIETDR